MRITLLLLLSPLFCAATLAQQEQIAAVLDDFHMAASDADSARYFGHYAPYAIFHGTDIMERWTLEEFQAYAQPHFSQGRGWTYEPRERHIYVAENGQTAWFDEILTNEKFGETRGTGVLVLMDDSWKVAQYHLTLPVPNDLIYDLVEMIEHQKQ